jgi:DNA repair protein RadC
MSTSDNPIYEMSRKSLLKQIIARKNRPVLENNSTGEIVQSSPKPAYSARYKGMQCRVCLVRENTQDDPIFIKDADQAYDLVKEELSSADREIFLSILLTSNLQLIGVEPVATGGLNQCAVSPADTFKSAIVGNAGSIIVCHNHPAGSLTPSESDIKLTELLTKCGDMFGIQVADHLIIGAGGYYSIKYNQRKEVKSRKKKAAV